MGEGYKCPKYVFCEKSVTTLRTHFKMHRCGELDVNRLVVRGTTNLQSLFKGSGVRLLQVTGGESNSPFARADTIGGADMGDSEPDVD